MLNRVLNVKYLAVVLLGAVILFLVSLDAFSQSEIDLGGNDGAVMTLQKDVYRQEVSYESYEDTCSREVYDGMREVCSAGRSETRCRKIPGVGDECWEESNDVCSMEPSYSTEYYTCIKERRVVNSIYDHTVHGKIEVVKNESAKNFDLNNCKLKASLSDSFSSSDFFSASCLEAIVRVKLLHKEETDRDISKDKDRKVKIELDFASIEDLSALKHGLSSLRFSKGIVSFITADLKEAKNFSLSAKLVRNRLLLKDKVLLNREIKTSELSVEKLENGKAKVSFNLAKMTGLDAKKKHTLSLALKTLKSVDVKGSINSPALQNSFKDSMVINE